MVSRVLEHFTARLPTSERCSDFEHGTSKSNSMFDLLGQTSKFEVGVGTSMFDVLPSSPPTRTHPLSVLFFVLFFLFLSFVFFHAKLRSQTSMFQLRTFKLEL